jgi:uncharacterized GH25 family protein
MYVKATPGIKTRQAKTAFGWAYDAKLALEIVPLSDPSAWAPGGRLEVALLFNGRPLRGVLIKALPQTPTASGAIPQARSDAAGRLSLSLSHGGVWLINAVHMRRAIASLNAGAGVATSSAADWESFWSSITLSLGKAAH